MSRSVQEARKRELLPKEEKTHDRTECLAHQHNSAQTQHPAQPRHSNTQQRNARAGAMQVWPAAAVRFSPPAQHTHTRAALGVVGCVGIAQREHSAPHRPHSAQTAQTQRTVHRPHSAQTAQCTDRTEHGTTNQTHSTTTTRAAIDSRLRSVFLSSFLTAPRLSFPLP
jgi:hypothetical protein